MLGATGSRFTSSPVLIFTYVNMCKRLFVKDWLDSKLPEQTGRHFILSQIQPRQQRPKGKPVPLDPSILRSLPSAAGDLNNFLLQIWPRRRIFLLEYLSECVESPIALSAIRRAILEVYSRAMQLRRKPWRYLLDPSWRRTRPSSAEWLHTVLKLSRTSPGASSAQNNHSCDM